MRALSGERVQLAATDLAAHLECEHLTQLNRLRATQGLRPPRWEDPRAELLSKWGLEHERAYLAHLRDAGGSVYTITADDLAPEEQTRAGMRNGADLIYQAVLTDGEWFGRADILQRVDRPSDLGDWSYEVIDTKLAAQTRAGTILQLELYSHLVGRLQGRLPAEMHVVSPGEPFRHERHRVLNYAAYMRAVMASLTAATGAVAPETYPVPVAHCQICDWWRNCRDRWHTDDALWLVAGLSRTHAVELTERRVETVAALASIELPVSWRPRRGRVEAYEKLHHQARLQHAAKESPPSFELLAVEPERGLLRLPAPAAGDLFFDLEGDRLSPGGGLEYLFGVATRITGESGYDCTWARNRPSEKVAFEEFVDRVMLAWREDPGIHVYHYAPYEQAAVKRLMGRYATREDEVDRMFRGGLFVDLYPIVRQSLRAGIEAYSIKDLEQFFGFEREVDLQQVSRNLRDVEAAIAYQADIPTELAASVIGYNRDDCVSLIHLAAWLEDLRAELVAAGHDLPRPPLGDQAKSDAIEEGRVDVVALRRRLQAVSEDADANTAAGADEARARWLLGDLLEFHRREVKAAWWELFRLRELSADELFDESAALAGLSFVQTVGGTPKCPIDRYRFPPQLADVRRGGELESPGLAGTVERVDVVAGWLEIKKRAVHKSAHPGAVFSSSVVNSAVLAEALFRVGETAADHGVGVGGSHAASRTLLLRGGIQGLPARAAAEDAASYASRISTSLHGGVLAIQGPPGSGKTYTGARMILRLVAAGRRVGVTAVSHSAIRNLLEEVVSASDGAVRCAHKIGTTKEPAPGQIVETADNGAARALLDDDVQVLGGTPWLWSRADFAESIDTLVVDEAGQMSLANAVASAQAAENLVLLGDPQQLEQPLQGSHPTGADVSALQHVIGSEDTMPPERGLFLDETYRLHPRLQQFTSELFYDGRLSSRPELEQQRLVGAGPFTGSGLFLVPVAHAGNTTRSTEEVRAVGDILTRLTAPSAEWIDSAGGQRALTSAEVLVVAPYNAQVNALREAIAGVEAGTVDRFQGQEAPVVIYSMTASSADDAPRGMEFLYSLNRFNVATSRARCVCIVVVSPALLHPVCRTPRQMQLANALCRYRELAITVSAP